MTDWGCSMRTPTAMSFRSRARCAVSAQAYTSRPSARAPTRQVGRNFPRTGPYRADSPLLFPHADEWAVEMVAHAQTLQTRAQRLEQLGQKVRSNVWPSVDLDLSRRAQGQQVAEHTGNSDAVLAARVEFSVGIRARATLAETVVGFGVELSAMKAARSRRRGPTGLPRSRIVEATPASAKRKAVQAPAGRSPQSPRVVRAHRRPRRACRTRRSDGKALAFARHFDPHAMPSRRSLRASSERCRTRTSPMRESAHPKACAAMVFRESSSASSGTKISTISIMSFD